MGAQQLQNPPPRCHHLELSCRDISAQDGARHGDKSSLAKSKESIALASENDKNIWCVIRDSAAEMAASEQILSIRLKDTILDRGAPGEILSSILSRRLSCEDMPKTELYVLMHAVFCEDESILCKTVADIEAIKERDPSCPSYLHVLLNLKGFHALQVHRISHYLWCQKRKELAYTLANLASLVFGVDIHPAAQIGRGVMLDHGMGIVIGETAVVDDHVSILQGVTLGGTGKNRGDRHPKIRTGVMIGAGAKVLGNIEIGAMSKIAAGSVVLKDVPPHSTVAGVPATIVRRNNCDNFPALEMQQTI
jgi:serine O-acetyltransferase